VLSCQASIAWSARSNASATACRSYTTNGGWVDEGNEQGSGKHRQGTSLGGSYLC
jgi:hypothetical protein